MSDRAWFETAETIAIDRLAKVGPLQGIGAANYVVHQFLIEIGRRDVADAWDEAENRVYERCKHTADMFGGER